MSRWFRFYDDVINDPKVLCLPEAMRWAWVAVLCIASKNDGKLPSIDHIALMLRIPKARAAATLAGLNNAGLLDKTETGFEPHNWAGRQYKSDVSTERVKRFRNGQRNAKRNVSETPPDTDTDTEQKKKETREDALLCDQPSDFEIFWMDWPNKVGKPAAERALRSALKRVPFATIMAGVAAYVRTKPPDRPWLNPATFLNQNRWEDRPAAVGTQNGKNGDISSACDRLVQLAHEGFSGAPPQDDFSGGAHEDHARLLPHGERQ